MTDFMTTGTMATFGGMVLATTLIVQFVKQSIRETKVLAPVGVRVISFAIALMIVTIFGWRGVDPQSVVLYVINAVIVSTSAMGTHDLLVDEGTDDISEITSDK